MKRILMSAAVAAMLTGLAPVGTVQAQHMASLDQGAADSALAAIGLGANGNPNISWERAEFRRGTYTFTNVVIHVPAETAPDEADLPDDTLPVDESELRPARDINVARMVLDSPRLGAAGELLLHAFSLEDIRIEDADGEFAIERIVIEAPNAVMSADLGLVLSGQSSDDFDAHWGDYRFGLVALDGFVAAFTAEEGPSAFTLDRFALADNGDDHLGRFEMLGFAFEGPSEQGTVQMSLAEVSADGLVTAAYSSVMDAAAAGASQGEITAAYYDASMANGMKTADQIRVAGMSISVPGIAMTLDELVATMEASGDILTSHMHLGSLQVRPEGDSPVAAQFAAGIGMLGYDHLDLGLESNSRYDSAAGRMTTTGENSLTLRDGLSIEFTQDIGGYLEYIAAMRTYAIETSEADVDEEAGSPDMLLQAVAPLIIHRFGMRLVDQSMLERGLAAGAATQGITPEEMRAQASLLVGVGLMSAPPAVSRTVLAQIATAISAFINEGGSLDITLAPPQPLTLGEITEIGTAETIDFDALGLAVTAEPPAGD